MPRRRRHHGRHDYPVCRAAGKDRAGKPRSLHRALAGLGYFNGQNAIPWPETTWDLRSKVATRNASRTLVLHFNTWESGGRIKRAERAPFSGPFAEAVRALVAVTIPTGKMSAPYRRLMALRAVNQR